MISGKRMKFTSAVLALVGASAIAASFAIGLSGWPASQAGAAPDYSFTLTEVEISAESSETTSAPAEEGTLTVLPAVDSTSTLFATGAAPVARGAHTAKQKILRAAPKAKQAAKRHAPKRKRRVVRYRTGPWQSARVSWYGPGFYGNTMAGGGTLTRNSMVVAHRSLPFGTKIQFNYKGRSVIATVRDRGPYVSGRTFDLGPGVARKLRFGGVGTVKYRIVKRR